MFCARPANYSPRHEDCPLAGYHSNTLLPHDEIHDPIDDSPVGHHIRNTVEFVAEMEREAIRDRMMGGKRRRVDAGKIHNWGFPPYGYRLGNASDGWRLACLDAPYAAWGEGDLLANLLVGPAGR
jgi:hypothetical protein